MLAIETVAVRRPTPVGVKLIWKLVLPPTAIGLVGTAVMAKSAALAPLITSSGLAVRTRSAVPLLAIMKVRTMGVPPKRAAPKSVWSATSGVVSPATIDCPFPCTSISGMGTVAPVP